MTSCDDIPEGFFRHDRPSGFTAPWEPIYAAKRVDSFSLGLRAGAAHSNSRGLVHGGLISALADNAMGLSCLASQEGKQLVTVHLSVDYLSAASAGAWIEVVGVPSKVGASVCFAEAKVYADSKLCARANGIFKVIGSRETSL